MTSVTVSSPLDAPGLRTTMTDLKNFGTRDFPLRASSLPKLLQCPGRVVLEWLGVYDSSGSSEAADTGSAVHHAINSWHKGMGVTESLDAMRLAAPLNFPLADVKEACRHFNAYTTDPRNSAKAVASSELKVDFAYKSMHFRGTLDQVRIDPYDNHCIWDVKTGQQQGYEMTVDYAAQLAGYTIAYADQAPKSARVLVGGIIRTRGYFSRGVAKGEISPSSVFYPVNMTLEDCYVLLDQVVDVVRQVRKGNIRLSPGQPCTRCPAVNPETCIPAFRRLALV